jgi:uncharacterized membrane protein YbhN (UPF0104 family)
MFGRRSVPKWLGKTNSAAVPTQPPTLSLPNSVGTASSARRIGKLVLRVAFSSVILSYLAWKIHWHELVAVVAEMHLGLTLTAFALLHVGQSFSSYRWQRLARPLGFSQPYSHFRRLFYIGTFFNLFLPTSIGGDAVRALKLAPSRSQWVPALGSVIADRVAGVTAMLLLACLATCAPLGNLPAWVLPWPWLILFGLAATLALLPRLARRSAKFAMLLQGLGWSSGRALLWWQAVGLSLIVQGFATLQVILLGMALHLSVPALGYFVIVPLVTLLTMLPFSLNGMGVREGSLVLLLAPYGVSQAQAVTLGLGWLALSLGVGLVGGILYLFFDQPVADSSRKIPARREAEPALGVIPEGKDSHGSLDRCADEGRARQRSTAA